jgi:hypothetical protein
MGEKGGEKDAMTRCWASFSFELQMFLILYSTTSTPFSFFLLFFSAGASFKTFRYIDVDRSPSLHSGELCREYDDDAYSQQRRYISPPEKKPFFYFLF